MRIIALFWLVTASALALLIHPTPAATFQPADGDEIFVNRCIDCHGKDGQGDQDSGTGPLTGDQSLAQLTNYINENMPPDSPEDCVGADAERVARHVFDSFYSKQTQAPNGDTRIELSRLTVRQYRNMVTDLIVGLRNKAVADSEQWDVKRGVEGRYFNKNRPSGKPDLARLDSPIKIRFAPDNPPPAPLDKVKGFSASWRGSIIAPETGRYKLVAKTNQAVRFWLNDQDSPLIDAWVQSGDQTDHAASIFLLGGRAYPFKLEFTARQQGVEAQKKYEESGREIFLELRWQTPDSVEQLISRRHFLAQQFPEQFVPSTPFPADDRSHGYLRGISVSKAWNDAITNGAIEAANYVVEHLHTLTETNAKTTISETAAKQFCRNFVARAFRRPLTDDVADKYVERRFANAPDVETAVKRVVLMTLTSPRALYLDFDNQIDAYDRATILSFALWDSIPDRVLLKAAADNQLSTKEELARHAERMLSSPRAKSKLRHFLHSWLQMDHGRDLAKNQSAFPGFDQQLITDLRTSLDLFLEEAVWKEGGDFRDLLRSRQLYVNGRIADFYGFELPKDAPFQKVSAKSPQRVGVLSHPYTMASFAYTDVSSPIHRGVFLIRNVIGRTLRPPPAAFAPDSPDLHPNMTTRERVAKQTQPAGCQACHGMINPIGFTLEHFDAVGRYRDSENGKQIDASGIYELESGDKQLLQNASDLANFLAENPQTHRSFALQLCNYLLKQPVRAFGPNMGNNVTQAFIDGDYNVPKLMTEIAVQAALATQAQ